MQWLIAFLGISMGLLVLVLFGGVLYFSMKNAEIYGELRDFASKRGISINWEDCFRAQIRFQSERKGKGALVQRIMGGANIFELFQLPELKEAEDQAFAQAKLEALSRNYAKSITLFFGSALALIVLSFLCLMVIVFTA